MHTSRVNPSQIDTKRLDSDYYRPEHLETEQILRDLKAEPLREVGTFWAGPFGSELPSSLYLDEGVPLFRVGNVGSMQVLYDGMAHLDPTVHEELVASEVRPGDLLVVKASVGEKICRVPDSMPRANITQHIIAIRPNGNADFDYIAAFLFGRYGRSQLVRRSLGSIIQYLGVNDARTVLYPPIDTKAQIYIGEKVRQAERLRERAAKLQREIDELACPEYVRAALATQEVKCNRLLASDLNSRLDSKYYGRRAMAVLRACHENGGIPMGDLKPLVSNGFEYRDFVESGRAYITVTEVTSGRLDTSCARCIPGSVKVPPKGQVSAKSVLVVRSGSIGTAVKVHSEDMDCVLSSDFIRLELGSESQAAAVACFLNAPAGRLLQIRAGYGGVQPHIGQEELLTIPIPQEVLALAPALLRTWDAIERSLRAARRLVLVARLVVEALVDQTIPEGEVIEVQRAIEKGDVTLDHQLLARMTLSGIDVANSAKLFPHLDDFYTTLDHALRLPAEAK